MRWPAGVVTEKAHRSGVVLIRVRDKGMRQDGPPLTLANSRLSHCWRATRRFVRRSAQREGELPDRLVPKIIHYWSSTPFYGNGARYQKFCNGVQDYDFRSFVLSVRCVR